jgi:hypothetical protein
MADAVRVFSLLFYNFSTLIEYSDEILIIQNYCLIIFDIWIFIL